jgi:hypothetical protein
VNRHEDRFGGRFETLGLRSNVLKENVVDKVLGLSLQNRQPGY